MTHSFICWLSHPRLARENQEIWILTENLTPTGVNQKYPIGQPFVLADTTSTWLVTASFLKLKSCKPTIICTFIVGVVTFKMRLPFLDYVTGAHNYPLTKPTKGTTTSSPKELPYTITLIWNLMYHCINIAFLCHAKCSASVLPWRPVRKTHQRLHDRILSMACI